MHKYICDNYVEHSNVLLYMYGYVIVKYYSNRRQKLDRS